MLYEYAILFIYFFKKPPITTYSKISLKQNLNPQTQTMRKSNNTYNHWQNFDPPSSPVPYPLPRSGLDKSWSLNLVLHFEKHYSGDGLYLWPSPKFVSWLISLLLRNVQRIRGNEWVFFRKRIIRVWNCRILYGVSWLSSFIIMIHYNLQPNLHKIIHYTIIPYSTLLCVFELSQHGAKTFHDALFFSTHGHQGIKLLLKRKHIVRVEWQRLSEAEISSFVYKLL